MREPLPPIPPTLRTAATGRQLVRAGGSKSAGCTEMVCFPEGTE